MQFVLNYEEGGENCVLHGDAGSEQFLSEIIGAAGYPARHLSMESIYEYGRRVGGWRILRRVRKRDLPLTVFGVAMAMQRNPDCRQACVEAGHEIASHGWRWIHYQNMRQRSNASTWPAPWQIHRELTGSTPLGWYTGRDSPNTRRLVVEHGGFDYDADYYGDDLPFWTRVDHRRRQPNSRIWWCPTRSTQRHALRHAAGLQHRRPFLRLPARQLRRAVRRRARTPRGCCRSACTAAFSVAPAASSPCSAFSTTSQQHERVWVCRRIDIARHWNNAIRRRYRRSGFSRDHLLLAAIGRG